MATQTAVTAQHATLTANSLETVTVSGTGSRVIIKNRSTVAGSVIYATINGADPAVAADDTIAVPSGETYVSAPVNLNAALVDVVVKLISSTADAYTVAIDDSERPYSGGGASTLGSTSTSGSNSDSAGTGVKSNVSASVSSVTILASNASRKRWLLFNDSTTGTLYLDVTGGTASTSSFCIKVLPGDHYFGDLPVNTGTITGIWDVASGSARVTEFA